MASMTEYLQSAIGAHVLTNTAYTSPSAVYLALFTSDPGEAGDTADEVSGGSYTRQEITFEEDSGTPGLFNNLPVTFDDMPAVNVEAYGIMDSDSGGEMLYYYAFSSPVSVDAAEQFTAQADSITIEHD